MSSESLRNSFRVAKILCRTDKPTVSKINHGLKLANAFSVINDDAIEGKLVIRGALRLNTEIRSLLLQTHSQVVADLHFQSRV